MSCHHIFFRQWNRNPFAPGVNMKRSGIKRHGCTGAVAALKTGFPAVCLLAVFTTVLMSQGSSPPVVTGNARVDKLLGQMTLDEKISLIHGGPEAQPSGIGGAGTWPGMPRLGIPSLRLVDGPPGISNNVWSTGMTSTTPSGTPGNSRSSPRA